MIRLRSPKRIIFQDTRDGRVVAYLVAGASPATCKRYPISVKKANELIANGEVRHEPQAGLWWRTKR